LNFNIGLVVSDLANPYGRLVHDTIDGAVRAEGLSLIASPITPGEGFGRTVDAWFEDKSFAGVIVAVASSLANDRDIDRISFENRSRVVLLGYQHALVDSVSADFEAGGFLATKHLIDHGHSRIAFVGAEFSDARRVARLQGYLNALRTFGKQVRPDYILGSPGSAPGSFATREVGHAATKEVMSRPNPPTAIFARNDFAALGALDALSGLNIRVPEDVSVVGFDGVEEGKTASPPLTSIVQPTRDQALKAVECLRRRLTSRGSMLPPQHTVMSCRLSVRSSSGNVKTP